jgi:hypothetical protein
MPTLQPGEDNGMAALRGQLDRRQARRFRRRWLRRWRRRRLLVRLLVAERELAEAPTEALASVHDGERRRIEDRLSRNARRLFR